MFQVGEVVGGLNQWRATAQSSVGDVVPTSRTKLILGWWVTSSLEEDRLSRQAPKNEPRAGR